MSCTNSTHPAGGNSSVLLSTTIITVNLFLFYLKVEKLQENSSVISIYINISKMHKAVKKFVKYQFNHSSRALVVFTELDNEMTLAALIFKFTV
jgi:spore germination protein GerM